MESQNVSGFSSLFPSFFFASPPSLPSKCLILRLPKVLFLPWIISYQFWSNFGKKKNSCLAQLLLHCCSSNTHICMQKQHTFCDNITVTAIISRRWKSIYVLSRGISWSHALCLLSGSTLIYHTVHSSVAHVAFPAKLPGVQVVRVKCRLQTRLKCRLQAYWHIVYCIPTFSIVESYP